MYNKRTAKMTSTPELQEAQKKIEELKKELEKHMNKKKVEMKVSQKGCVQINGLRKFPFTFYKSEIQKILSMKEEIEEFIVKNDNQLT